MLKIGDKMPSFVEEQKAISVVLTKSDDEIKGLKTQRDKYALIKQGMMQELLTGKIRLKLQKSLFP